MKFKSLTALCCSALCAFTYAVTSVNAAMYTNDGITAEIIAENNYLNESDTANVLLKVTNNNDFAVNNISIESIIPEGLKLSDTEEISGSVKSLAAGETIRLSIALAEDPALISPGITVTTSDSSSSESQNDKEETTTSVTDKNNTSVTTTTAGTTTSASSKQSEKSSPKTGEHTGLKIFIIAAIIALAVLILSSRKRTARTLSLFLALSMGSAFVNDDFAKALENEQSFTVSEKIYFGENSYDVILKTSYDTIYTDPSKTYTRGEWIINAAKISDIDSSCVAYDEEHYDYFYGDTMNTENGLFYEYLNNCGVIPYPDNEGYEDPDQDIPLFEDFKEVTREYAVYSAVKLLGFENSPDAPVCSDAASLRYPAAVSTALKFNMIGLENGCFNGDKLITESEYNQITAVMKAIQRSVYIKSDESVHNVTFVEGVIADEIADLTGFTVTENGDNTYTAVLPVNNVTSSFTEGTVFVLPSCDNFINGISLKAVSVEKTAEKITVSAVMPEIYEVLTSMAIMDSIQPDPNSFIPAEGIKAAIADTSEYSGDPAPLDIDIFDIDKEFHPSVPIAITGSFFNDKLEVEGTFSVPMISVIYKTHWEAHLFAKDDYVTDEAMFCINPRVEANISGVFLNNGTNDDDIKNWFASGILTSDGAVEFDRFADQFRIGEFPVPLPAGFSVELGVYLKAEVSGKFTIGFAVDSTLGKQYINGETRNLNKVTPQLTKIELAGEIKAGPKVELSLGWTALKKLIGVDVFFGPRVAGSITGHPDAKLLCLDARVHMFLEMGLSDDTKLGGFLAKHGWELRADIINDNNSPLNLYAHFENFHKVSDCTYGNGKLQLHIKDSEGNDIKQAKVVILNSDGSVDKTLYSDSTGIVTVNNLSIGTVSYEVKATGFNKFTDRQLIRNNQTTYAEAIMLVSRLENNSPNGSNTVFGTIKDAETGNITDASFKVQKEYNAPASAEVIFEGKSLNGKYSTELPVGYYTITFSKDGYLDCRVNVTVRASASTEKNIVISAELEGGKDNTDDSYEIPEDAQMRIVLTWGAFPEDLDSHLIGSDSSAYHIYFPDSSMNYYDGGIKIANLDVDDTSSYGPETITIFKRRDGEVLHYYVHDYTDRYSGQKYMSNSGAHVSVYAGTVLVAEFNTPIDVTGNLWHVFDYNPDTKEIVPVNTYSTIYGDDYSNYSLMSSK